MTRGQRQTLYFTGPKEVALRQEPLPPIRAQAVLVATEISAISSGTEMLFYRGQVPGDMAVDATIAGLGEGFSYPLKYGYAVVGRVVALGSGVDEGWLGQRVFAFHPHESHFVAEVVDLFPVPEEISVESAVMLPFMETAVSFLMDGQPLIGERVAVFGQGVVGLLTTGLLAGYPLGNLITLDPIPARREWSNRLGAANSVDPTASDVFEQIAEVFAAGFSYQGADLVYELSGSPKALDQAIAISGYDGRVVVGSWYGRKGVHLDLGGRFHRGRTQLISSQVSIIAPQWRGRFDQERRLAVAWSMLAKHQPEKLISHRFSFAQAAEAYALIDGQPGEVLQVVLTWD